MMEAAELPGSNMHRFSACRNLSLLSQRRRSTSSRCIVAIWPTGLPNELKPSFTQKRRASRKGSRWECPRLFARRRRTLTRDPVS